jgi:LacI family transcriptional regulator
MSENPMNVDRTPVYSKQKSRSRKRVAVDFLLDYGYGLQLARGMNRYRSLHPETSFQRVHIRKVSKLDRDSIQGAIGHFYDESQWDAMHAFGVPFVISVSNRSRFQPWAKWIPDDREIGRVAARYFLRKNYRNFAVISIEEFCYGEERLAGFLEVLADQGIHQVRHASPPLRNLLELGDLPLPLALFVTSDAVAVNVITHLHHAGYNVPEDVAVLGVDDDEVVAPFSDVPLSSVQLPLEEIGFDVCAAMEEMIRTKQAHQDTRLYAPLGVVERRSTESLAVQDPLVRKFQSYVETHIGNIKDVREIADALFVHSRTLDRKFLTVMGMSPTDWLQRRRVEYAEKLFKETDYTVAYVAELSGLVTPVRLYRAFKKLSRPLPSVLRREIKRG